MINIWLITGYCIPGFVCEVQICTNSARCCGLTDFTSSHAYISSFHLSHFAVSITVLCLVVWLTLSLYKYFKRVDNSILLHCSAWSKRLSCTSFITATLHAALLQCNSTKHPCKCGILWSYSLLHRILLLMTLHMEDIPIFKEIPQFDY